MILLDAIFIIELFLKVRDQKEREDEEKRQRKVKKAKEEEEEVKKKREYEEKGQSQRKVEEEDYILRKIWLANGIYYDLLLLENQLHFFVLEKLYMFACKDYSSCNHREEGKRIAEHKKDLKKKDAPFVKLFCNYFTYYDQKRKSIGEEVIEEPIGEEVIADPTGEEVTERRIGEEVRHFTDVLRYLFCPPYMEEDWKSEKGLGCQDSCKKKQKKRTLVLNFVPQSLTMQD
jgi:hypothetical protein